MSTDTYAAFAASPSAPARRLLAVTPTDGADLPSLAKALFVGAAGDLRIVPVASVGGEAVTLKNHPIGYVAGHEHIAPGRKNDPGPGFDWRHLRSAFAGSGILFPPAAQPA